MHFSASWSLKVGGGSGFSVWSFRWGVAASALVCCLWAVDSGANGINRNGVGARGIGMGGASNADVGDAFAGMAVNPSLLGYVDGADLSVGVVGVMAEGVYENGTGSLGYLDERSGVFPEIVVRSSLDSRWGLGFSLIPEQARIADWVFRDPEGGIDGSTSYGVEAHRSEILAVRAAAGIGLQVSDSLSVGASVGAVYNENRLRSPYLFQSHPALAGFKTLLDLQTDGVGVNGDLGVTWRPSEAVAVGLTYRTPTRIETEGWASGDIGAQLRSLGLVGVPSAFRYRAEVENELPQVATAGISWQVTERTRVAVQVDWVGWSSAFDELTVSLTDGNNEAINGLLGSDGIVDTVPLDWEDRLVYRAGVEHRLSENWTLRSGYAYAEAPMPTRTMVPMTAAISEYSVSVGVGYAFDCYQIDLSYQMDLPTSRRLSDSEVRSGEYRDAVIDLEAHWLALTVRYDF